MVVFYLGSGSQGLKADVIEKKIKLLMPQKQNFSLKLRLPKLTSTVYSTGKKDKNYILFMEVSKFVIKYCLKR